MSNKIKKRDLAKVLRLAALYHRPGDSWWFRISQQKNGCLSATCEAFYAYTGHKSLIQWFLKKNNKAMWPQMLRAIARALEHGLKVNLGS